MGFIRRVAPRPLARKVKMADLRDNLDMTRLSSITPADRERAEKYKQALSFLESIKEEENKVDS